MMDPTTFSMPEVTYYCPEQFADEIINSIRLIETKYIQADSMANKIPNSSLSHLFRINEQAFRGKKGFM